LPLSGDVVGFDYTFVEATLGLGVNLQHELLVTPIGLETDFTFSSPIQVLDTASGLWGPAKTFARLEAGESVQLRAAGPATTLGILPTHRLVNLFQGDWNLLGVATAGLRTLELSGYGLDLGPVIDEAIIELLGTLDIDATHQERNAESVATPLTLQFNPLTASADGLPIDLCAGVGCPSTGFLPVAAEQSDGWKDAAIYLVDDLPACVLAPDGCAYDPEFQPLRTDFRRIDRDDGTALEFARDNEELLRVLSMAPRMGGPESDLDRLLADLREFGIDLNDPSLPGSVQHGRQAPDPPLPFDQAVFFHYPVDEPTAGVLFALAACGLALARGRRDSALRPGGSTAQTDGWHPLAPIR